MRKGPLPGNWRKEDALRMYPRLTAHLICESLGYFTPSAAANAIAAYRNNHPYACEWYSHQCMCRRKYQGIEGDYFHDPTLLEIGRDMLAGAFKLRKHHSGYMAEYKDAWFLVTQARESGKEPVFASWF